MKKLSLFLVGFLLLVGGNVYANALISSSPPNPLVSVDIFTDPNTFSVINRSGSGDSFAVGYDGYTGTEYSGYYIGTITAINNKNANDNTKSEMEDLLSYYLGSDFTIMSWDKVDEPDTSSTNLTITYDADKKSGAWTTTDPANPDPNDSWVSFYTVKAADEFALYYLDPTQQSGIWSTKHTLNNGGNIPVISHFQGIFGDAPDDPPGADPIPEPGTIILLGFGLIGVAGIGRRKFQK